MPSKKDDITLRDVINHVDYRFGLLDDWMGSMEKRMDSMTNRMTKLETTVAEGFRKVKDTFQRAYTNRSKDLVRLGDVEDRLDDIQNKELPAIKSHS
jgi:uncharacterized protein YPO0396